MYKIILFSSIICLLLIRGEKMGVFDFLNYKTIDSDKLHEAFKVEPEVSPVMKDSISLWRDIYVGEAPWIVEDNNLVSGLFMAGTERTKSLNMGKLVSSELSRLSTLDIDIQVTGSSRAIYLQELINVFRIKLREKLELGVALGGLFFKPNSNGIDFVTPYNYIPITFDGNENVTSIIFIDKILKGKDIYVRGEYHDFNEDRYIIENKAFISKDGSYDMKEINLENVPEWQDLKPYFEIRGLEKPLFSQFKMPGTNNIDMFSPLGVSCYSNAIDQLEDLDIAYTRMVDEIYGSNKILFLSQYAIDESSLKTSYSKPKLPNYVRGLEMGVNAENTIHEHNPVIQTDIRKNGINLLLSFIGYSCGFSNGYFQFNEKTGLVTATQIEADQQRTVQTVADIRQELQESINNLIYAIDEFANIYKLAPKGTYETNFYFKDITANFDEDRIRNIGLVKDKIIPKWKYLVEFEGYTEEDAKLMVLEAEQGIKEPEQDTELPIKEAPEEDTEEIDVEEVK